MPISGPPWARACSTPAVSCPASSARNLVGGALQRREGGVPGGGHAGGLGAALGGQLGRQGEARGVALLAHLERPVQLDGPLLGAVGRVDLGVQRRRAQIREVVDRRAQQLGRIRRCTRTLHFVRTATCGQESGCKQNTEETHESNLPSEMPSDTHVLFRFCAGSVQPALSGRAVGARPEAGHRGRGAQTAAGRRRRSRGHRRLPRHLRRRSRAREAADRRAQGPARRRGHRPGGHGGAQAVHAQPAPEPVPHAPAQRRVVDDAAPPQQRRAGRLHRLRARLPVLSRPRHPDPVARHVRQAQRLLERRQALRRQSVARSWTRSRRCPPSAPAASRGSTCSRSTASSRRGSPRSPRAPGCRRWPAAPRA